MLKSNPKTSHNLKPTKKLVNRKLTTKKTTEKKHCGK